MRIRELRRKEVINITDGGRLGFVGDVDYSNGLLFSLRG